MTDPEQSGIDRRDFMIASTIGASAASMLMSGQASAQADTGGTGAAGGSSGAAASPPSSSRAGRAVEAARDAILRLSREVWAEAELSLAEDRSSKIHIRELEAAGFRIVSAGTSGTPTAFIAEWSQGNGGPAVGFWPEYDARPGLGNAAEARQTHGP